MGGTYLAVRRRQRDHEVLLENRRHRDRKLAVGVVARQYELYRQVQDGCQRPLREGTSGGKDLASRRGGGGRW